MKQQFLDAPVEIVWFSCGITSAVASLLASKEYPNARFVYCDLSGDEHEDNVRFRLDVQNWIGRSIEVIRAKRYRTTDEVFIGEQFMAGHGGARCTTELKKLPRLRFARPDDIHIFGYSANEGPRIKRFEQNNPDMRLDWILFRHGITKEQCFNIVKAAGIKRPVMYDLGFANNNCIACVKARGVAYWTLTRRHFPKHFERRAKLSRQIGCRLIKAKGELYFLDELDLLAKTAEPIESISCGPECGSSE